MTEGEQPFRAFGRPFNDPKKPGRRDKNGVEWWACDPYPTWYRWENGELILPGLDHWDEES